MNAETESWLIRTPQGWAEPRPPRCSCGSDQHLIGWIACPCGEGPHVAGHRTWQCRECGFSTHVGCTGNDAKGFMREYGCG